MNNKILFLLGIMIFILGCKNDCDDVACFTPPTPFLFEIIDNTTGENLFTNGTYQVNEIEVVDLIDDSNVGFDFIDEDNIDLIRINSVGWQTETVNILVRIADENIFNLVVDAELVSENCCSYTNYNEIEIENAEFQLDSETGIYKILVE